MVFVKLKYFNNYSFLIKLLALLILCIISFSCNKNETKQILTVENAAVIGENAVNINTASVAELEKLPNIGTKLAQKIVEHRERYGKFRKPEHLILVSGISDRRFRQLQSFVKTD
jgi:competence ComEA-like helix-hairpin-helix protein